MKKVMKIRFNEESLQDKAIQLSFEKRISFGDAFIEVMCSEVNK